MSTVLPYKPLNPEYVLPPFGLANTGSICWMNSFLQMLFGLSAFNQLALELQPECSCNAVSKQYLDLLIQWKSGADVTQDTFAFAGSKVSSAFTTLGTKLHKGLKIGTRQECVDEAFTLFIEMINIPKITYLFTNVYECSIRCSNCATTVSVVRDNSIKIEMFSSATPITTETAFRDYILHHTSTGDTFTCSKCNYTMREFTRVERLRMLRECVVIVFNKYLSKELKWFPPQMQFKALNGPDIKYQLCAQIEHSGSMHGGHYYMYTLRNGKWYLCNDSSVSASTPTPTPNTYMICYQMVPM